MARFRRPESVLVVIHAGRQVLLLRRRHPHVFWQSVTGSLEPDELPSDTARRELAEETGLEVSSVLQCTGVVREFTIDPRWRDRYAPGVLINREHEFRLALPEPFDVRVDPCEHDRFEWVDLEAAIERVWSSTNKAALQSLSESLT